jgi:hypothetical protein
MSPRRSFYFSAAILLISNVLIDWAAPSVAYARPLSLQMLTGLPLPMLNGAV